MWWRSWLPLIVVVGPIAIVAALLMPAGDVEAEQALTMLGGLILLAVASTVALIFLLNRAGRIVAQKRYQVNVTRFIGWSVYWRMWLMILALAIPAAIAIALGAEAAKVAFGVSGHQAFVLDVGANALDAILRLFLVILACGWALGRALRKLKGTSASATTPTRVTVA